jgi:signal peptidase I
MDNMRSGSFEEAWQFSDRIIHSGVNRDYLNLPRHYQCIWDGTPLNGKRVLIRCYHGLGDTIQFIRYAPLVKEISQEVIVWVQPRLMPLLEKTEGVDKLIALHDGVPEVEYDVDVEIMELAHVFRTTISTIPLTMPYIHVTPARVSRSGKITAGIVWQSGDWDPSRSIPFFLIKNLLSLKEIDFYILQDKAESSGWEEGYGIHPGKCSLLEHAQIIAALDLLITIDSMPAHLAGAMNVPVWLMLSAKADWRWMENRSDSPWYPSMRLFRQEKAGDWAGVVDRITLELKCKGQVANCPYHSEGK